MRTFLVCLAGVLAASAVASLALAGGTPAQPRAGLPMCAPLRPGASVRLAPIDGRAPVVLHVGRTARPGAPLVLALPGAGQRARDFATYTGYSALADRDGFSVAYPTATGDRPFWNISGTQPGKPDDIAYLRAVIPAVVRAACADAARVGVTGVSNGGGMSARVACDAADLVVAAAPVAGGYGSLPACHPSRPVAILEVHGLRDEVVPYDGKGPGASGAVNAFLAQWRELDGCQGAPAQRRPRPNVWELRWSTCAGGTVLQHEQIADAEHGWPGEDDLSGRDGFSATRRTWAFLSSFRRR